jgi:acetyl esterase/lipase
MLLGWNYRSYYHNAYAFNQYMAAKGYGVLAVNYRSGGGSGLDCREALDYGAAGASEYNDVVGAGLFLRAQPDVDPARIGLWGGSYGGYLTAMGLARASDMFAAGVDVHGVHDWNNAIRNFMPNYNQERRPDIAAAPASSPMASRRLALAGAPHPRRRRSQRAVQRIGGAQEQRWARQCMEQLASLDEIRLPAARLAAIYARGGFLIIWRHAGRHLGRWRRWNQGSNAGGAANVPSRRPS